MVLKYVSDFAKQVMAMVLQGLNDVEVYLGDIGISPKPGMNT